MSAPFILFSIRGTRFVFLPEFGLQMKAMGLSYFTVRYLIFSKSCKNSALSQGSILETSWFLMSSYICNPFVMFFWFSRSSASGISALWFSLQWKPPLGMIGRMFIIKGCKTGKKPKGFGKWNAQYGGSQRMHCKEQFSITD